MSRRYSLAHFSSFTNSFDGLNAGTSRSGTITVVFLEILRAVFALRCLTRKVPKPLRLTSSLRLCALRTCSINSSTTAESVTASIPVSRAICFTTSAFVIFVRHSFVTRSCCRDSLLYSMIISAARPVY